MALNREIIIAAAGLIAAMDVTPVRLGHQERRLAERLRQEGFDGVPITAGRARGALPKRLRRDVSRDQIADALDKLVDAGRADRDGNDR